MIEVLSSIVNVLFAFAAAWFFIDYLTVHPRHMSFYLMLSIASFLVLGIVIYLSVTTGMLWLPIVLTVIGIGSGFYANGHRFLNQEDPRAIPAISRVSGTTEEGHTAIVYFTHGEPDTYNPIGWLNQFREFDEQGIKFVPFVARPFFVYALRNKYLEVGKSTHQHVHRTMIDDLEKLYRAEADNETRFYLSFLDAEPRPDAAVINALNDGAARIVVANVFLTVSNHTAEGRLLIDELEVERNYGVEVVFTEPMWSSQILKDVFIEKAHAAIGETSKEDVAVAFVGHGQPDEWDVEWATETEQEAGFRRDLIDMFVEEGYRRENLGSAWMEFKSPKPAELMGRFVNNGVKKVLYFSTAISAEAIHSEVDVPRLVAEYSFPEDVEVVNLGAWNNHPTVINAIKTRIDEYLEAKPLKG